MKTTRKIISIDEDRCTGCGQCITDCAEGALEIVDGKARLVGEKYCDGLGACLNCPEDALSLVEAEVEPFDEEAVEELLAAKAAQAEQEPAEQPAMACGCPGSNIVELTPRSAAPAAPAEEAAGDAHSRLGHWPVQIRLVPPNAPFLENADLLVTADCVPVALPDFHARHVEGKVVMLGCPKFDNAQEYIQKFAEIFAANDINSVTTLEMEVPCCSSISAIVAQGMNMAGKDVPIERLIVGRRGDTRTAPAARPAPQSAPA
jgi:ferredoxin